MKPWWRAALLAASVYWLISGVALAELAGRATDEPARFAWRMTSWILGAITITLHIAWEQLRLRTRPLTAGCRVAIGVAIGMALLAATALIRAFATGTGKPGSLGLAIVLWPVIAGVPTFLATLAASALLRLVMPPSAERR